MVVEERYGWRAVLWGLFFAILTVGFVWQACELLDPNWQGSGARQRFWEQVPPLLRSSYLFAWVPLFGPVAINALYGYLTRSLVFRIDSYGVTCAHVLFIRTFSSIKWTEIEVVKMENSVILLQVHKAMRRSRPWMSRKGVAVPLFYTSASPDAVLAAIAHYRPDLFAARPTRT